MKATLFYNDGTTYTIGSVHDYAEKVSEHHGRDIFEIITRRKIAQGIVTTSTTQVDLNILAGVVIRNKDAVLMKRYNKSMKIELFSSGFDYEPSTDMKINLEPLKARIDQFFNNPEGSQFN